MPLSHLDTDHFLREVWQQQALLIRQGVAGFQCPVDGDDLAGLACEAEVESRLVESQGDNWRLRHGPFSEDTFSALAPQDWTLLVQRVDHWIPEVADLIAHFDFLPRWRIDDIMISYAVAGGGVGPHYDNYDVFLIQGSGQREWRIGQHCDDDTVLRENTELTLLADFHEQARYTLEPGDVLYLPPGLAHWGAALSDDCITLSVGFRAPSAAELLSRWCEEVCAQLTESERYRDTPATLTAGNRLTTDHIDSLRALLRSRLDDVSLIRSFGELVTEVPDGNPDVATQGSLPIAGLYRALDARMTLYASPKGVLLFANGASLACTDSAHAAMTQICDLLPGEQVPDAVWSQLTEDHPTIAQFLLSTAALSWVDE